MSGSSDDSNKNASLDSVANDSSKGRVEGIIDGSEEEFCVNGCVAPIPLVELSFLGLSHVAVHFNLKMYSTTLVETNPNDERV